MINGRHLRRQVGSLICQAECALRRSTGDNENGPASADPEYTIAVWTALPQLQRRLFVHIGVVCLGLFTVVTGRAAAQDTVGSELCGTPIAEFINSTIPLLVALVIIVGTVFAFLMHVRAGVARDAEQARFYFDWRNRAGYTAVTAPLLAFLLQLLLGFTGTGITNCIDLTPFF